MTPLKEGGHTQANQLEEQPMLRCHLEADGAKEGKKKCESEKRIKRAKKSNKKIRRQKHKRSGNKAAGGSQQPPSL